MKTLIINTYLVLIMAMVSSPLQAQDTIYVVSNNQLTYLAEVRTNRLTEELKLTEAQRKEVYKILLERMKDIKSKHADQKLTKPNLQKTNGNTLKQLEGILTKEQIHLFQELRSDLQRQKNAEKASNAESLEDKMLILE